MKFLIFLFICLSSALISSDNEPCGPVVTDFDTERYSGFWYFLMKTPNKYDKGYNCSNIVFYNASETAVNIALYEKVNDEYECVALKGEQHGNQGILRIIDGNGNYTGSVNYLYVEYDNYSIAYQCNYNDSGTLENVSIWVTVRRFPFNPEIKEKAYEKIQEYFDVSEIKMLNHDEEFCAINGALKKNC